MVSPIQSTNRAYHCRWNSAGTTENRKNLRGGRRASGLSSTLRKRKGWTISERRDNPDAGAGIFAAFQTGGGMTRCSGSCPKVEGLFRPVGCHEQTTHVRARPEKKRAAPEATWPGPKERSERRRLGQTSGISERITWNPKVASGIS